MAMPGRFEGDPRSWLIALLEYCLAVPANRLGYRFSGYQLKVIQEVVTIAVFIGFATCT